MLVERSHHHNHPVGHIPVVVGRSPAVGRTPCRTRPAVVRNRPAARMHLGSDYQGQGNCMFARRSGGLRRTTCCRDHPTRPAMVEKLVAEGRWADRHTVVDHTVGRIVVDRIAAGRTAAVGRVAAAAAADCRL